jgi:peroxiredoxin
MGNLNKQGGILMAVLAWAVILAGSVIAPGCKDKPATTPDTEQPKNEGVLSGASAEDAEEPSKPLEPAKPQTQRESSPKLSLDEVIRSARGWGAVYTSWYGRTAPDFTLTDIAGKQHKLSDYRGKDVMLVFWATWCRPCIMEIPHLIALQNVIGKDKLAVLAISYITPVNTTEMVKRFVEQIEQINYTVFSTRESTMPAPYNTIQGIPSSFFINPKGKIKLATSGLLTLGYMKAILEAE